LEGAEEGPAIRARRARLPSADRAAYGRTVNVLEAIRRSAEFLERKGVDSPRLQAELLLAHVLTMPRMKLYLNFERTLSPSETESYRELVQRRGKREPLQHILGSTSFAGLELHVSPHVLVPRPETELLAEQATNWLRARGQAAEVLDFGTGSGCLAVAIATACPTVRVQALDVSADALEVARSNARRHQVEPRIQFVLSDGLSALGPTEQFDLVVSNPPYIPTSEIPSLDPEVRDFDPRPALDGGMDGLDFHRMLAAKLSARLRPGGVVMLEIGDGQAPDVTRLLSESGWKVEAPLRDLSGRERILIARPTD
jgi:release factor glutamine methyltransferase